MGNRRQVLEEHPEETDSDQREQHDDVEVCRWREERSRFFEPAQVGEREECDEANAQLDAIRSEAIERRNDCCHATGDGNSHREDVVDEHRSAGNEGGVLAEVLPRHDVGATTVRIGEDRLAVTTDDDREQDDDEDRDRNEPAVRRDADAGEREKHDEDFLCRICGRGDGIACEDGERDLLGKPVMCVLGCRNRVADDESLEPARLRHSCHMRHRACHRFTGTQGSVAYAETCKRGSTRCTLS